MPKVLIADDVVSECARILVDGGLEVADRGRMSVEELEGAVDGYQGLIVRSGVKVTKDVIEAGRSLQVIGRAGIGVDNIDCEAATRRGVIVMNAPLGNVISAAEHALAMLMALSRNIPRADRVMRAGRWDRKKMVGVEMEGKTFGIVGVGKVGSQLAKYARAFGMRIVGYDPHLVKEQAQVLGVELIELDGVLEQSDFISFHVPLNDGTRAMIGAREFKKMKTSARIVNNSRGGVIDESALVAALKENEIAGAAVDVFETEPPPEDHPLRSLENAVLTPHLGASTEEAQVKVAESIATQFVAFFRDGVIRNAVNMAAVSDPSVAPFMRLAEDLGSLNIQLGGTVVRKIEAVYMGEISNFDTGAITNSAVSGVLHPILGDEVNVVNARIRAQEKGIEILEDKRKDAGNYKNLVSVRISTDDGTRTVSGTIFEGNRARIVQVDKYDIDLRPSKYMMFVMYPDLPGMIGRLGTTLGNHGINIAQMELGRSGRGERAVVVLTLDDPVTEGIIGEIRKEIQIEDIRAITLP